MKQITEAIVGSKGVVARRRDVVTAFYGNRNGAVAILFGPLTPPSP